MKKMFIVEYSTKCRKASRDYKKIVETDNMEEYIKKNFVIGYSYHRGDKMFHCAMEVVKTNWNRYDVVKDGDYYYIELITLSDGNLKKNTNWKNNIYYDGHLKRYLG